MSVRLGIDVDTTTMVAAYWRDNDLIVHDWGTAGYGFRLPAFIRPGESTTLVGKLAHRQWLAGDPQAHLLWSAQSTAQSPLPTDSTALFANIVRDLGNHALAEAGEDRCAVIAVPPQWPATWGDALGAAAAAAGMTTVRVISRPVAAAASTLYPDQLHERRLVLVFEGGEEYLAATLMEFQPGRFLRVLEEPASRTDPAGSDLADALIAAALFPEQTLFPSDAGMPYSPEQRALLQAIGRARTQLNAAAARITNKAGGQLDEVEPEPETIRLMGAGRPPDERELSYARLVDLLQPVCERARLLLEGLWRSLAQKDTVQIALVGPLVRLLPIQDTLARVIHRPVQALRLAGAEADRSVARGAALIAANLVSIASVLPYGLGIIAREYNSTRLRNFIALPRGTPLPARQPLNEHFQPEAACESSSQLQLGVGDSPDPEQCISVSLDLAQPLPESAICQFTFAVDETLMLLVEARDHDGAIRTVRQDLRALVPAAANAQSIE